MKEPSEFIKEFAQIEGATIRSRQVRAVCEFLDCQHNAMAKTLNEMDAKIAILEDKLSKNNK